MAEQIRNPKPEIRRNEGNPKSEKGTPGSCFGFLISDFLRISGFGFRIFLLTLLLSQSAHAQTLSWWRFEDGDPGHWLDARLGSSRSHFSVTADSTGNGNALRTFNTQPTLYPPDTSPEFSDDVAVDSVTGQANHRSMHFNGKQYLYTVGRRLDESIKPGQPFTIEGMFKLAVLPGDHDGKTQVVLCKIMSPTTQPTRLTSESANQLGAPPTSQRTNGDTTRPSTLPSTTQSTTRPSTTQADALISTELANDHPPLPITCLIAGRSSKYGSMNHFVIALLDQKKQTHMLVSRRSLFARQWYAFAIVSDGKNAQLYISDLKSGDYQSQATTDLGPGMMLGNGRWTVGCGMVDDQYDSWFQGYLDEIRISVGAVDQSKFLAAGQQQSRTVSARNAPQIRPTTPDAIVNGLADPSVLKVDKTYYLYGTREQDSFPVYTSTDLKNWDRGPIVFRKDKSMWGESRFWAPSVIACRGKYFMFYSALGPLHDSGDRHSLRVCIAVADKPAGPFVNYVSPLPLNGKAAIDPEAFVDRDGKVYLYFVSDCSENLISQIYAIRMNDDLTGTIGEPVLCVQPSQVWEGNLWNEAPAVFRTGDIYVLMYSAQWWAGDDYSVGFATSRSPLGPWTKDPDNPILQHYRGLRGTGGACAAVAPDGKGMVIFFHAQGPPTAKRRDTYCDQLRVEPDARLGVNLRVEPLNN